MTHLRIGLITTSWPSPAVPWAGHFIRDQAQMLARAGHDVVTVAPWRARDGGGCAADGVELRGAHVPGGGASLAGSPMRGAMVLAALRQAARGVSRRDIWLCHWWPTLHAAPRGTPAVGVLHGSDVALMEALPTRLIRHADGLIPAGTRIVAVAPSLARRFARATGRAAPVVVPLGARPTPQRRNPSGRERPYIVTVGRETAGKGFEVAREAAAAVGFNWRVLSGIPPSTARAALGRAALVVVPSLHGRRAPAEGRPHVITQGLVAGTPVVGGPNPAVREALREAGQLEVNRAGPGALAIAVRRALEPDLHRQLVTQARLAGSSLTWSAVLPRWQDQLSGAVSAYGA